MSRSLKTIFYTALSLITCGALAAGSVSAANKTLTIKGSNADTGDTIQIPDTAEVSVQVADEGITITMPNLDLRLRCLGDVTADGYCYVAAGGAGGGGSDNPDDLDFDRVPDVWDQCPNTPAGAPYTDKRGCAIWMATVISRQRMIAPRKAPPRWTAADARLRLLAIPSLLLPVQGDQSVRREPARLKREARCLSPSRPIRTTLSAPLVGLAHLAGCLGRLTLLVLSPAIAQSSPISPPITRLDTALVLQRE